jgi:MFS family permease
VATRPIASGLLIMPITVPMIFVSPFSGRLIGRFGARRLTAGIVFGVAGLLAMDRVLAGAVSLAATGAVFHALRSTATPSPPR